MSMLKGCLFDLDGVLVDTAKYHFLAWRSLAKELGFTFREQDNERLKGVSRQHSLDILLEIGGVSADAAEKTRLAGIKNTRYVGYIQAMTPEEILPGAEDFLITCRNAGCRTALVSASKNAPVILDKLRLAARFDAIVDGSMVQKSKPDPEGYLLAVKMLKLPATACVGFEDAVAGITAIHDAGMFAVGIGAPEILAEADFIASGLGQLSLTDVVQKHEQWQAKASAAKVR